MSQGGCAFIRGIALVTVAQKHERRDRAARSPYLQWLDSGPVSGSDVVVMDEMETLEHTKLKPLSIAVAVVDGSRLILEAEVSRMPAKGRLAA